VTIYDAISSFSFKLSHDPKTPTNFPPVCLNQPNPIAYHLSNPFDAFSILAVEFPNMQLPFSRWSCAIFFLAGLAQASAVQAQGNKPLFASEVVTKNTPGHAVAVDVDITGAKQLALVVTDGGDGFSCDWAAWAEPRLIGPNGVKKLTDL
jgi:hypothetical protein